MCEIILTSAKTQYQKAWKVVGKH